MSEPAIEIENIGKKYLLGETWQSPYLSIRDAFSSAFKKGSSRRDEFWALKNINLTVDRGDSVAIIGRNGAGKSTLLKILSRITHPTEGVITCRGKVASLLEVGTGFHPELTGRENITLNGAILGLTRTEINRKFDEIVDFSGVEQFLETPLKHYSSGMQLRLAFAVAAHLEPEILIIDEVLAVGDHQFQQKCIGKMSEVSKSGRTILFVSHNMGAIRKLCNRAVLLEGGTIVHSGPTDETISRYLANDNVLKSAQEWAHPGLGEGDWRLLSVKSTDVQGTEREVFLTTEEISVSLRFNCLTPLPQSRINVLFMDEEEDVLFASSSISHGVNLNQGEQRVTVCIPGNILRPGRYKVAINVGTPGQKTIFPRQNILTVNVESDTSDNQMDINDLGRIRPQLKWTD